MSLELKQFHRNASSDKQRLDIRWFIAPIRQRRRRDGIEPGVKRSGTPGIRQKQIKPLQGVAENGMADEKNPDLRRPYSGAFIW